MKSLLRRHRPSPALIVASLALFVSLSGVSYGVATDFIDSREIKNNEVRSVDIRNNEIRTKDLRNNEVRGIDIRNSTVQGRDIALNTVTGEDVKEDTLQKVPSALLADSATTAESVPALKVFGRHSMTEGSAPVTLAKQGPFTLSATCDDNAGATRAQLQIATTEDNTVVGSTSSGFTETDLDTGDTVLETTQDPATPGIAAEPTDLFAMAPSGKGFTGQAVVTADAATNTCVVHGHLVLEG